MDHDGVLTLWFVSIFGEVVIVIVPMPVMIMVND